jgi:hypothetical protein
MKQIFFFFAMLAGITACAIVTITPIGTNYSTNEIKFKVDWNAPPFENRVWIWVDFCPITGSATPAASYSAASVSGAVITAGAGTIIYSATNTRGFFVQYANTYNTAHTVTATLSNPPAGGKWNWCAYGSDFPPNVTRAGDTYTFRGTPPFILKDANGSITQTVTGKTLDASGLITVPNYPVHLTDKTGYPFYFCKYTGSDLIRDGTHLCQMRPDGAQNWEAWIKDPRDGELYRIVQFSDDVWWWAEDYRNKSISGYRITCKDLSNYDLNYYSPKDERSNYCPTGWTLPTVSELNTRYNQNAPKPDQWGGDLVVRKSFHSSGYTTCRHMSDPLYRCDIIASDQTTAVNATCQNDKNQDPNTSGTVRCIRKF